MIALRIFTKIIALAKRYVSKKILSFDTTLCYINRANTPPCLTKFFKVTHFLLIAIVLITDAFLWSTNSGQTDGKWMTKVVLS